MLDLPFQPLLHDSGSRYQNVTEKTSGGCSYTGTVGAELLFIMGVANGTGDVDSYLWKGKDSD